MEGNFYSILLRNVKMTHTDLEVIKLDYVAEREKVRERLIYLVPYRITSVKS